MRYMQKLVNDKRRLSAFQNDILEDMQYEM